MPDDLHDLIAGPDRAARRALVDGLLARGCTPEQIRKSYERGRLSLLPLEHSARPHAVADAT